jgi:hypothetical protein
MRTDDETWPVDNTPFAHLYTTWSFASESVHDVFGSVIAQGYTPRALEAYDENDDPIHPNDVPTKLVGAIVCVFSTLEKMLFTGHSQPGGRAWQFYANLGKVQVLQPPVPLTKKRMLVPSYGPNKRRNATGVF